MDDGELASEGRQQAKASGVWFGSGWCSLSVLLHQTLLHDIKEQRYPVSVFKKQISSRHQVEYT
jgi:hypothetical protein